VRNPNHPSGSSLGPPRDSGTNGRDIARRFSLLSRRILRHANQGVPRLEFMREMSRLVLDFSGCDSLEVRLWGPEISYRWQAWRDGRDEIEHRPVPGDPETACHFPRHPVLEKICLQVSTGPVPEVLSCFTRNGSFWTSDALEPVCLEAGAEPVPLGIADQTRSLCIIGFAVDDANAGILLLESGRKETVARPLVEPFEAMAQTIGLAIADRRAQAALRERVKELSCLYGIARLVERRRLDSAELLPGIAEQVRIAFQYPEQAEVSVTIDERDFVTDGWQDRGARLEVPVEVNGDERGLLRVGYPDPPAHLEQDPFLPEETSLLEAVAREIARLVERDEVDREKGRLQDQLRHADRLATIGQLSAGIAHELNEPLANILGFAQLLGKAEGLPGSARGDVTHIETAALHAREVIRKLMLFARQTPPRTGPVDLNNLVREGLYFLEGRCAKNDIELVRRLGEGVPEIEADASQLLQVLVNLVVNAIQAMPHGGKLTITTSAEDARVRLSVEDTGTGMSDDVRRRVFIPFFTTKDVHDGTGLGLAVVDGIVAGHGGTIEVESKVGVGTTFTVALPRRSDRNPDREE